MFGTQDVYHKSERCGRLHFMNPKASESVLNSMRYSCDPVKKAQRNRCAFKKFDRDVYEYKYSSAPWYSGESSAKWSAR